LTVSPEGPADDGTGAAAPVDAALVRVQRRDRIAPAAAALAILAGVALVSWILLQVPGEVFNSGDGGLKALQVHQVAAGDFSPELHLQAPPWVRELWSQGAYPFHFPFVYATRGGHVPQYPLLFAWLSAPFYAAFGYRGLFVLPTVALVLLWLAFAWVCRRAGVPPRWAAAALAAVVLASPLTVYGAMFYEHTLAVLLLFVASAVVALPERVPRVAWLVGAGAAAGLAPWLRSESWCLLGGLGIVAVVRLVRERDPRWAILPAAAVVVAGGDLLVNHAIYGTWFGAHGAQVLDTVPWRQQLVRGYDHLLVGAQSVVTYFPLVLFVPPALLATARSTFPRARAAWYLAGLATFDLVTVPFILPVAVGLHWGPRYLLVIVPLVGLTLAVLGPALASLEPGPRISLWMVLVATALAGAQLNLFDGTATVVDNYRHRVWPALELLRALPEPVLVVNNQYCSADLAPLLATRSLLRADDDHALAVIADALAAHGQPRFHFVVFPFQPMPPRFRWGPPGRHGGCVVESEQGQFVIYACSAPTITAPVPPPAVTR
jgi:hypothetical protein